MEAATSLCSPSLLTFLSPNLNFCRRSSSSVFVAAASQGSSDQNYRSQLIGESMIALRKRIHEMKIIERNYKASCGLDGVGEAVLCTLRRDYMQCSGVIAVSQSQLMNTRPCMALGMLAVIALSVPASTTMIAIQFLDAANGALSAIHHIGLT